MGHWPYAGVRVPAVGRRGRPADSRAARRSRWTRLVLACLPAVLSAPGGIIARARRWSRGRAQDRGHRSCRGRAERAVVGALGTARRTSPTRRGRGVRRARRELGQAVPACSGWAGSGTPRSPRPAGPSRSPGDHPAARGRGCLRVAGAARRMSVWPRRALGVLGAFACPDRGAAGWCHGVGGLISTCRAPGCCVTRRSGSPGWRCRSRSGSRSRWNGCARGMFSGACCSWGCCRILAWGGFGRLEPVDYPADWAVVRESSSTSPAMCCAPAVGVPEFRAGTTGAPSSTPRRATCPARPSWTTRCRSAGGSWRGRTRGRPGCAAGDLRRHRLGAGGARDTGPGRRDPAERAGESA